jgi:Coenzyme PQQ synthesis protein D (PqqD)
MTYTLSRDVTAADTDHGVVLLDQRTGRYWQLNDTGALVLRHLLDGGTVASATDGVRRAHPDAGEQADHDVTALVAELRAAGLVTS